MKDQILTQLEEILKEQEIISKTLGNNNYLSTNCNCEVDYSIIMDDILYQMEKRLKLDYSPIFEVIENEIDEYELSFILGKAKTEIFKHLLTRAKIKLEENEDD